MNDFLQSLRNSKTENQRIPMTRKTYNTVYHQTNQRFTSSNGYPGNGNAKMKRIPSVHQSGNQMSNDDNMPSMLTEAVETLNTHIETLSKKQEFLVSAQERTADMLERQAVAMERIVDHLNYFPESSSFKSILEKRPGTAKKTDRTAAGTVENLTSGEAGDLKRKKDVENEADSHKTDAPELLGREEIMGIIHKMRKEGAIFDQIAKRLIALGQPTFSGRGEWHAQTIHRLCSR